MKRRPDMARPDTDLFDLSWVEVVRLVFCWGVLALVIGSVLFIVSVLA